MNITETITQDRVLRGAREFRDELALLEHMFDHRAHGMAESSTSLVGTGTPARRPAASRQPASPGGRRRRPCLVVEAPALPATCRAGGGGTGGGGGPLRRAALPLERELPGRRVASRGAGGGGSPPPPGGAG